MLKWSYDLFRAVFEGCQALKEQFALPDWTLLTSKYGRQWAHPALKVEKVDVYGWFVWFAEQFMHKRCSGMERPEVGSAR